MRASNETSSKTAQAERPDANAGSSSSTAERYSLSGPTPALDPRQHAFRRDLADIHLAGQIMSSHYARPLQRSCGALPTFVRARPEDDAEALSEILPGEGFSVLEYVNGWAWGFCDLDHLVGYVEAIELTAPISPTHIVCERCAPVAADSSITSPVLASIPLGSLLHGEENGACLSTEFGCISSSHLRRVEDHDDDPVVVAERLIGAPYLRGGRSHHGIDGSGLVQLSLALCGHKVPRLVDGQRELGDPVPDGAALRRGDLVIFEDHAGLMVDDLLMIHACPKAGKVTVDPVALFDQPGMIRRRLSL